MGASSDRCTRLLLNGLGCNETHLGLAGCGDNRFGISRIIFLTLYERANILRRNEPGLMAKRLSFPSPITGASAGLKDHETGR